MEKLRQFIRTEGVGFLSDENITSIGIGYKTVEGKSTDEVAIQFTVEEKAALDVLESLDTTMIPPSIEIDGVSVPTDVIERTFQVDYVVVAENEINRRKIRLDPIQPGVSVANKSSSAGTLGCIVYDKDSGAPYILSNWHVLHGNNGRIGDDVVQPGPRDDNRVHLTRLGKLVRSHLGPPGDCAIASIEGRGFNKEILDLGVEVEQIGEPELGDKVVKSGRTTDVTHGIVRRVDVMVKINYRGSIGARSIGGFEIGPDPNHPAANSQISMPGDSGSVWLFTAASGKPTKIMAGLHFAGEGPGNNDDHGIACYPSSVFEKLGITLIPPASSTVIAETFRLGYDPEFLTNHSVEMPKLSAANEAFAFERNGSSIINYTHFSLALNKSRRFAFWVAWNIDGSNLKKLNRKGIPFILDPDIPAEYQIDNFLYKNNPLDRGHIARRADLLWGTLEEAQNANSDSFFFPNILPQMEDFNQTKYGGIWGRLEDEVFNKATVKDLRVSVFGGPIFSPDDRIYRGIKIPQEFFKVIVYVESDSLRSKGFILTQNLNQLEKFDWEQFEVFEATLTEIEKRCGFRFAKNLRDSDRFVELLGKQTESLDDRKPIANLDNISW